MTDVIHKTHGPADVVRNNAEAKRNAARAHRADAERSVARALAADAEAEVWEAAARKLES